MKIPGQYVLGRWIAIRENQGILVFGDLRFLTKIMFPGKLGARSVLEIISKKRKM